jgi:hypothetical protein
MPNWSITAGGHDKVKDAEESSGDSTCLKVAEPTAIRVGCKRILTELLILMKRRSVYAPAFALALCVFAAGGGRWGRDEITYTKDIAPLFARKCTPCHRAGGPAPFKLDSYDDVKRRIQLVSEVALSGIMPPTDALSDLGRIVTEQQLTDQERITLQRWIKDGLKEGGEAAIKPEAPEEWRLGSPDIILKPKESFQVPADGAPFRKQFFIELPNAWFGPIRGFDLKPASPRTVRYARVGLVSANGKSPFDAAGSDITRVLGTWAPGYSRWQLPTDAGTPLVPSRVLAVEVYFQPSGKAESGSFELGLYRSPPAGLEKPQWQTMGRKAFELAPGQIVELKSEWTLPKDIRLISIHPELRYFARQIRVTAQEPGEVPKTVLMVLTYDANWPGAYNFDKPVVLKKGTKIEAAVEYDNSQHAFGSRERETFPVRFGPKDTDETFWVHLQYLPMSAKLETH